MVQGAEDLTEELDFDDELDIEYFPKAIQRIKRGNRWIHIDPTNGKRTYPSWYKRSRLDVIDPADIGLDPRQPTDEDELLAFRVHHQLGDDVDLSEGVQHQEMVEAVMEAAGVGQMEATGLLNGLWICGLVTLEGQIHAISNRPMNKTWYLSRG